MWQVSLHLHLSLSISLSASASCLCVCFCVYIATKSKHRIPLKGVQCIKLNSYLSCFSLALSACRWQNILSKAIKYALFDPTKEMAYIPLDQESKVLYSSNVLVMSPKAPGSTPIPINTYTHTHTHTRQVLIGMCVCGVCLRACR